MLLSYFIIADLQLKWKGVCFQFCLCSWCISVLQSLDPLPMQGPELGVQADDIEAPGVEREPQQEVLENKDVRLQSEKLPRNKHCFQHV